MKTGRYSHLEQKRIAGIMSELEKRDKNIMDLTPEVLLLRALLIDFVNRYDDFVEQLEAWYRARSLSQKAGPPPPSKIPDLADAKDLIEGVSRIVERIHKIEREGSISLDTFRRLVEEMGVIVSRHVADQKTLAKIERDWQHLAIEPKTTKDFKEEE